MSWGVATQNGVSVSLASIVSLSCGATEFSPASLFTSGVAGAWYDPSDYGTLFQDSAGTTPVTAVEQPVGLMLDKSQGLVLGPELITPVANQDFSSDTGYWTKGGVTAVIGSGVCTITGTGQITKTLLLTIGKTYKITYDLTVRGGSLYVQGFFTATNATTSGAKSFILTAISGTLSLVGNGGATDVDLDNISVKELPGNHASQATAASRPVLRARYNQVTYSEQFDNAAWGARPGMLAFGSGSVANATAAPDGTTTADLLVPNTVAAAEHYADVAAIAFVSGASYTISVYAKAFGYKWLRLAFNSSVMPASERAAWFDVEAGTVGTVQTNVTANIVSVGNGWYRCSISRSATSSATPSQSGFIQITNADGGVGFTANGTSGMYWWGADLRTGSSAGTYQRIAAATDYATAGFLPYLALDGTDDSFGTNSIDFSATDKMSVVAGVKDNGAATQWGTIAELSAVTNANNGSFALYSWWSANWNNGFALNTGGSYGYRTTPVSSSFSNTNVITAQFAGNGNISTGILATINSVAPTLNNNGSIGTGNFGAYPLYIGRRNNASLPFNGRIYQLIVCGKELSASELASTEAYVNSKTGAY